MTTLAARRTYLRNLERIIIDAVSGMDVDDCIGDVQVHYSDGSTRWLCDVIRQANELRDDAGRRER